MNAGGRPNTCKSDGPAVRRKAWGSGSGGRVRNAYATNPGHRDSPRKRGVIPDVEFGRHRLGLKARAAPDGRACH